MMTQVVVINPDTKAKELRSIILPVPAYDIGMIVEFPIGADVPGLDQGEVTGYHVYVTIVSGELMTQVEYEVDGAMRIDESEIEGYWPVDEESIDETSAASQSDEVG